MADEESAMVVSAVLDEFFDAHSTETSLPCAAIIVKLIKNAALQEKFRRVRLSNPKIQQGIVRIAGALDILALAGFAQEEEQEFLVYTPPSTELTLAICNQLESRMLLEEEEKLEAKLRPVKSRPPVSTTTTTTTSFLSDEERRERQKKARNAKRARNAERAETHQRWLEDKRDRQEAAARKEAALAAAAKKEIAPGITIRPLPTNDNNDYRAKIAASWRAGQEKEDEKATTAESDMDIENDAQIQPTTEMDCDLRNDGSEEDRKLPAVPPSTARAASDLGAEDMKLPAKKTPILPSEDHENTTNIENVVSLPSAASNDSLSDLDRKLPAKSSFSPSQQEPSTAGVGGDEDRKLPAKSSFSPSQQEPPSEWDACLEHLPLCAPAEGIRESSVYFRPTVGGGEQRRPTCLKRLLGELDSLGTMLPLDARCSIFVRFDEETPQYLRALMAAPLPGPTPYSGGLFCFDIYIPNDYPNVPPKFKLLTTGGGTVRFGPNLYADGKVCLSLLGTWPGPKWSPRHSTLYQVLISIQGLVLGVEHPYFLEPGHGGWEGRIKEGDFQAVGKTLKGEEVKEEIRLPREVGAYEDVLRVGTIRFAMLETLQGVVVEDTSNDGGGVQVLKASKHLAPFALPILAHFYHNREAILTEVRSWLTDRASSAEQLKRLVPKLEAKLLALSPPRIPPAINGEKKDVVPLKTNQSNAPSECRITSQAESNVVTDVAMSNNDGDSNSSSPIESLRRQMQEAATAGDFVLAGRLQSKVQQLEDLERRMKEAAAENNFIRAGRLQEQYQALLEEEAATGGVEDMSEDGEEAEGEEWDVDDEFSSTMGPSGGQPHPLMGHNNVFVPSGYHNQYTAGNHSWGTGYQLSSTEASSAIAVITTTASVQGEATVPRKPSSDSCRLRIRLPVTSKSVVEEFDCNDALSSVYRRLEPQIRQQGSADGNTNSRRALATPSTILTQPLGITSPSGTQAVAVSGGAFARPLSVAGYTLLLSHPKREYSLEMHGTKSLLELGLTPSATLTVMMCADRGVVYRGDLESRLDDAQGNAMDVDGLTYEGLLELTERVGVATPEHGRAFIDEETLERNSILISPASYMTELDTSTMDVSASHADEQEDVVTAGHRCPICLGDFDVNDTEQSLRKLKKCSHVFHIACLATWLTTKSSCPICKQSLS